MIHVLSNRAVLLDYGPMHIVIQVLEKGKPLVDLAQNGGKYGKEIFRPLVSSLPFLKKKMVDVDQTRNYPIVARRMIESTKRIGDSDLTPMCAVAGTIADEIANFIFCRGGTKVIVENGGDIAIRLKKDDTTKVGLKTRIDDEQPSFVVAVNANMGIGGIATSGLGGRSFTKGIASAVTVLAETSSLADAAATAIANATNIYDPCIERSLAEKIYADTDIQGEWVTIKVGDLSDKKIRAALNQGIEKAYKLSDNKIIMGAVITVKGKTLMTKNMLPLLQAF